MKKAKQYTESLNLFEAACLVKMSPELLECLTTHTTKWSDNTKLLSNGRVSDILTFEKVELLKFNKWLQSPWPKSPTSNRPHIPSKIRDEIIKEAGTNCAICHSHSDKGHTNRYEVCPKCGGEGNVTGQFHEMHDKTNYEFVECPQCNGDGTWEDCDCSRCGGESEVPRFTID